MKQTIICTFAYLLICVLAFAQSPQKFNYQGIARDTKGNPLSNQKMSLKLSVLPTADATVAEYEETQNVVTNEFGLYTLQIGNGTVLTGTMKDVKWETGNKYIKVAIDAKGGTDFVDIGTSQLLSVPYALYADKSGSATTTHGGTRTGTVASNATHVAGDANYVTKFTALNTIGKSSIYDNGNFVGIGTTTQVTPLFKFQLQSTDELNFMEKTTSLSKTANFRLWNSDNKGLEIYQYGSAGPGTYMGLPRANLSLFNSNTGTFAFNASGDLVFGNNATPRLYIQNGTGNIGIGTGTTAPAAKLDVNGQVRIQGGTPGVGKVLTSDATGLATWTTPISSGNLVAGPGIFVSGTSYISNIGDIDANDDITTSSFSGGDISGNFSNIQVIGIKNIPISSTTPTVNQVLTFSGTEWVPNTISSGGNDIIKVDNLNVNSVVVQNNSLIHIIEDITISSNLTTLDFNGCKIDGGKFTGTGSEIIYLGLNATISNTTFENVKIFSSNATFINCTFNNLTDIQTNNDKYISCSFSNCISNNADEINTISFSKITNCTFYKIMNINNCTIESTSIGNSNGSCNTNLTIDNCKIKQSFFLLNKYSNFSNNYCDKIDLLIKDYLGVGGASINTCNVINNTFRNFRTGNIEQIEIDPQNQLSYFIINIKNNTFILSSSETQAIRFTNGVSAGSESTVIISENSFRLNNPLIYSNNLKVKYTNNMAMQTTHPTSNGNLIVLPTNY